MDKLFQDYNYWIRENQDFISKARKQDFFQRNIEVLEVTEHIYKKFESKEVTDIEKEIFLQGFNYLYAVIMDLKDILGQLFENDIVRMNTFTKTLDIYFYLQDFIMDIIHIENDSVKEYLSDMENYKSQILESLTKKRNVSPEIAKEIGEKSQIVYLKNDCEYNGILTIFSQLYDHYQLY